MSPVRLTTLALALGLAGPASAANVFFDDFSGYGPEKLNATSVDLGNRWTVTDGSVDLLTAAGTYGPSLCVPDRNCIDLDGSTGDAGVFSTAQKFGPGRYTVTFQLAGNRRIDTPDVVTVSFGSVMVTFGIGRNDVVASNTAAIFDPDSNGLAFDNILVGPGGTFLSFANAGGDNQGAILKSATVDLIAAVPLPAGGALLFAALGGLGWVARRRRNP